jgi:hypothetical protein
MARLLTATVLLTTCFIMMAAAQSVDPQVLITPGVGVGPVKVGTSIADVIATPGAPKNTCHGIPGAAQVVVYTWFPANNLCLGSETLGGLLVITNSAGETTQIQAFQDSRYQLENGLRCGAFESLVRSRMGGNPVVVPRDDGPLLRYPTQGISFKIRNGSIAFIGVFKPEQ